MRVRGPARQRTTGFVHGDHRDACLCGDSRTAVSVDPPASIRRAGPSKHEVSPPMSTSNYGFLVSLLLPGKPQVVVEMWFSGTMRRGIGGD
jgi:hypothetical protein